MLRHIASKMAASDEYLFRPILRQYPDAEFRQIRYGLRRIPRLPQP
jgi:hypothetical protein